MKAKKTIALIVAVAVLGGSTVLAEDVQVDANASANANTSGIGQPPRPGGMMNKMFGGERKEIRQDFREGRDEAIHNLREDIQEKRDFMRGSSTPGMATPTPWKNFRDDMKGVREDMRGKMASITETQLTQISAKLGITVDELKAKLATGTNLREIVGNKITREEMMKIMPMMNGSTTATGTRPGWRNGEERDRPQGFVNSLRSRFMGIFGAQPNDVNVNASTTVEVRANAGFGGFFKKLFNF